MSTTSKTLLIYLKENLKFKKFFFGAFTFWTSGMLLQKLVLPLIVANVFNTIVASQGKNLEMGMFTKSFLLFALAALVAQGCLDLGLYLLNTMEIKIIPRLYNRVFKVLLDQSMHFHNNTFSGSLVNQTNRFIGGYVTITDTFIVNFTQILVLVVFSSVVLAFYSIILALTILVWAVVFIGINVAINRRRVALSRERAYADTLLTGYLADTTSNISAVKTFAAEKREELAFHRVAVNKANKYRAYWLYTIRNDAAFGLLMSFLQILVLIVSIILIQRNAISLGTLILSQVYITQIVGNLWGLSSILKNVEQSLSDAGEMTEILEREILVKDKPDAAKLKVSNRSGINFENVKFTHAENSDTLFSDLNLSIQPGEKIGLVGPSGGGKTTITKLLLRLNDIQDGTIKIGDTDITSITQESLRSEISYVPQEPILFHRTLSENIAYGKDDATEKQIKRAAELAHADDFIKDLPKGYKTLVGERGVKLSGGQRQRIAIARAMLKNAPILVLDEATSALDSESEVLIQDALWTLMEGRTAIVIAHRLSTIQKMDRIIVLDEGKILEEGSHDELIKNKGKYAELWNHQSGGFIEE